MKVIRSVHGYMVELPSEIKEQVVFELTKSESLKSAVESLRQLTLTDKDFSSKVNHPIAIRALIQLMAQKFDAPSEYVAKKLSTAGSKKYIDLSYALITVLWKHDFDQAEKLLSAGADIDFQTADNYPVTCRSDIITSPEYEKIKPKGITIYYSVENEDCLMSSCFSLVMYAIASDELTILEWLIKHKANLNITSGNGDTALLMAISLGKKDIVELLIKNGALINQQNRLKADKEMYDKMSNIEADQTRMISVGELLSSLTSNQKKKITNLVSYITNELSELGETPLIRLIYRQRKFTHEEFDNLISLLLTNGADLNKKDDYGSAALIALTFIDGKANTLKLLLDRGADLTVKDNEGLTALDHMREEQSALDPERKEKIEFLEDAMKKWQK